MRKRPTSCLIAKARLIPSPARLAFAPFEPLLARGFFLRPDTSFRLRAERKAGELLKATEKAKGTRGQLSSRDSSGPRISRGPEPSEFREPSAKTLRDHGLSYYESSRFQKLADVPEELFEKALASEEMPTTVRNHTEASIMTGLDINDFNKLAHWAAMVTKVSLLCNK